MYCFWPQNRKKVAPNFYTLKLHRTLFAIRKVDEPAFCASLQITKEKQPDEERQPMF